MNLKLFAFILVCMPVVLPAQDSLMYVRYLTTSNWAKMLAALDYISPARKEKAAYVWGNRSEWSSYNEMYYSETTSKYQESEDKTADQDDNYEWRKDDFMVIRDFEKNTLYEVQTVLGQKLIVEDSLQAPAWVIRNDMKEVAGHICMNAELEDTIKLQKITAWFALDMPGSYGPERLYGLPGVILEVDINNGSKTITADKIEKRAADKQLDKPKKMKGKKVNEAEYTKRIQEFVAERKKIEEPFFWGIRY